MLICVARAHFKKGAATGFYNYEKLPKKSKESNFVLSTTSLKIPSSWFNILF